MRHLTEHRYQIYLKDYQFLSFAKTMLKSLSSEYGQKLHDSTRKLVTEVFKTASKRTIQNTADATDDLVGNKIAEKLHKLLQRLPLKLQVNRRCLHKLMKSPCNK